MHDIDYDKLFPQLRDLSRDSNMFLLERGEISFSFIVFFTQFLSYQLTLSFLSLYGSLGIDQNSDR